MENWLIDYHMNIIIGLFFNPCYNSLYFIQKHYCGINVSRLVCVFLNVWICHVEIEFKPLIDPEEHQCG